MNIFGEGGTIGGTCVKNLPYFCRGLQNARVVAESATAGVHTYWVRAEVSSNIVSCQEEYYRCTLTIAEV